MEQFAARWLSCAVNSPTAQVIAQRTYVIRRIERDPLEFCALSGTQSGGGAPTASRLDVCGVPTVEARNTGHA